jgi:hypothetical protein
MATLLLGTTVGGYAAIHAGNIASQSVNYASSAGSVAWANVSGRPTALSQFTNDLGNYGGFLTSASLSGYATQSWVSAQGYLSGSYIPAGGAWSADFASNGFTRQTGVSYSGGEWVILTNNAQISTLIDGSYFAGESGGFYSLNSSSYYSSRKGFYNDGTYANFNTSLYVNGDILMSYAFYPGYNNGSAGNQGSYYFYGNTSNSGIRTNGNLLVNNDIYLGTRGQWLSTYLNQNVRTDSNPSFNSVYLGGSQVTSSMVNGLSNMLGVTTLPYSCDIIVNGDPNTFYAVQFWGGDQDVWRRIIIKRGYGEQAPWDPIGTGVHHGGLLLDWEGNFGGWGGAEYADRIRVFNESYTNVCADMFIYSHSMGYVFMLRGGGAIYHLFSDQAINGFYQSGSPDILYNTSTLSYDDNWSGTNVYDVYAPAPLSLSQVNSSRIDGLRTKKQSLLDGRYLRQGVDIGSITNISATNFMASNAFYLNGTSYYLNSTNGGIYTNARFESASTIYASGGNSSQWNTAYGWGNHASAGYVPGSRTITINGTAYDLSANRSWTVSGSDSTKLPLAGGTMSGRLTLFSISGVNQTVPNDYGAYLHLGAWGVGRTDPSAVLVNTAYRADYADSLFDMNISRFTNNSGYVTSSGSVAYATSSTRLYASDGTYVYGGANPYYLYMNYDGGSYWELKVSPATPGTVRVAYANTAGSATSSSYLTGGDSAAYMLLYNSLSGDLNTYNSPGLYSAEYIGSTNRPFAQGGHFIQISDAGGTDVKTQWYYGSAGTDIAMRIMWGNGAWKSWRTLITDSNIGSQSVSYSTQVGINYNNDSNSTYQLLWGSGNSVYGTSGVYVNPYSDVIYARGGFISPGNAWGTADSAFFPNGITTAGGDNWIYGHTYIGNAPGNGNGHEFWADGNQRSTGHHYLDANYGQTIVGRYSSTRYQGVWAMGDSYKLPMDGSSTGSLYGLAWSHPNAGGVASNLNTHGLLVMENGTFLAAISGSIRARDDVRAPAIYDSGSRVAISRGEGRNYVDYSRYVYNNGAYSGSGWIEPSDLGVRYANSANYANSAGSAGSSSNADRLYPFGACYNDTHPGYGLRAWYDWAYCGSYKNGITLGSHPSDQSYGWQLWQNMWDDRTYTRRYNGGWQSTRTLMNHQDDPYAANMNQYVRTSDGPTFTDVYNNSWFRNNSNNTGLYNQTNGNHFYSNGSGSWGITGSGGNVELQFRSNHQTTVRGYVYGDTSSNFGLLNDQGGWSVRCYSGSGYGGALSGSWTASGDLIAYSDERVKTNISTIENALEKVLALRGVTYERTDSEDRSQKVGVIAQEIQKILPQVVHEQDNGMLGVSYGNIVGVLIEAIKEQQKEIEELKTKVN